MIMKRCIHVCVHVVGAESEDDSNSDLYWTFVKRQWLHGQTYTHTQNSQNMLLTKPKEHIFVSKMPEATVYYHM